MKLPSHPSQALAHSLTTRGCRKLTLIYSENKIWAFHGSAKRAKSQFKTKLGLFKQKTSKNDLTHCKTGLRGRLRDN